MEGCARMLPGSGLTPALPENAAIVLRARTISFDFILSRLRMLVKTVFEHLRSKCR
jgi:hypothetical protein